MNTTVGAVPDCLVRGLCFVACFVKEIVFCVCFQKLMKTHFNKFKLSMVILLLSVPTIRKGGVRQYDIIVLL